MIGGGEEEKFFDLFVTGLQGVINRPELKTALETRCIIFASAKWEDISVRCVTSSLVNLSNA